MAGFFELSFGYRLWSLVRYFRSDAQWRPPGLQGMPAPAANCTSPLGLLAAVAGSTCDDVGPVGMGSAYDFLALSDLKSSTCLFFIYSFQ